MSNARRDDNYITTLIAVSNVDGATPVTLYADPTTHRLLVSATIGTLDDLSDVVVTSGAQGDILYNNGTNWVNLAPGTSGYFLKTQGAAANPTWAEVTAINITIANEATDTTCFPLFVTAATGDLGPKSNAGLTFNSSTGNLGATILSSTSLTASEILATDASKNLVSLAVATYPSLTELTYVKGVTSAIQTQIDTKAPTASPTFTGTVTIPTPFTLGAVSVTSTGTELNILDGVTATATELNYLDIVTLGTGAASKAVVLDAGDDYIWPATGLLTYGGTAITATGAEINILDGATLTVTELNYVDGVTSAIQTQLNAKAPSTSPTFATSITGSYLTASEILITDASKNIVSAAVATYPSLTELTYVKGVTSAIQTQLNAKGDMNDLSDDTSPTLGGALDAGGFDINNGGVIFLTEQAEAEVDVAGKGQIWVDTATPNVLMFTDDAGTDFVIANNATTALGSLGTVSIALTGVLRADSGVLSTDTDVTDIVSAASTSAAGKVELADVTETNTGTDTGRAVTPDGLSSAVKSIMLTAAGGAPLTTAGCSEPTKVEAATNDINYYVLDFDTTTEEHAFWSFCMPENWDAGTVTAQFYWTNAAGLTTETVAWGIAGGSWGNDDAIDAALGTEVITSDTWLAQGDLHISAKSTAITIANAAAGEWVNIVVARKVASDNLTGDARLIAVKLTYTIDQYSDEI